MSVHEVIVLTCDRIDCDRALIPTGDGEASRIAARAFARVQGWATADHHPAWIDLCPAHAHDAAVDAGSSTTSRI